MPSLQTPASSIKYRNPAERTLLWLGAACLAGLVFFGASRLDFYLLGEADRAVHAQYENLKPSGIYGLSFGVIGTVLIFLNLGYLIRRKYIHAEWMGSLRSWMALHVFTGVIGGGLILYHSAFIPKSPLGGVAFYSLLIVLITGVVGRTFYSRIPRSLEGRELELEELRLRILEHTRELERVGVNFEGMSQGSDQSDDLEPASLLSAFSGLVAGNRQARRDYNLLRSQILSQKNLSHLQKTLLPLAERYCKEQQWFKRYHELRYLMGSWRFLHRWFAISMLVMVAFHIFVAVGLGEIWILRGIR